MKKYLGSFGVFPAVLIMVFVLGGCVTGDFDYGHTFPTEDYLVETVARVTPEETKPEVTKETVPEETKPEATKETVPEETKPEATKETVPEVTKETVPEETQTEPVYVWHEFANQKLFEEHYQKHVVTQQEFGDITKEEYLKLANDLLNATGDNILTKTEDDGDLLFYDVDTNGFAVMRPDGVIRSFFKPSAGIDYWNRQ